MKQYWMEHWTSEEWFTIARRHGIPVLLHFNITGGCHSLLIEDKRTLLKMFKLGAESVSYIDNTWRDYLE